MEKYLEIIRQAYSGYFNYFWREIFFQNDFKPWWQNYFWMLVGLSLVFFGLEVMKPWRENQKKFRKDFWQDVFYMFFNFFLFSLIFYNALSMVIAEAFNDFLGLFGVTNLVAIELNALPMWLRFLIFFILSDFIQWNVHRLLHRVPWLWEFHKLHHSVTEMGFAAHLRFHWMETLVYKGISYLPLAMIGFGLNDLFILHVFSTAIGHFNHANFTVNIGPLKYIFNNPEMHIWHHSYELPDDHPHGVNYGLTLSIWDYLFGTAWIPRDGRDIELGFPGVKYFPTSFIDQFMSGFKKK